MITNTRYIDWYKKEKRKILDSGHFASEPKFLFMWDELEENWIFNPDNWNGGDILRHYLLEGKSIASHEIRRFQHDGQTTIFIFKDFDFYEISWYKNRGRTEIIKMNGEPIFLDDYITLCNSLNITLK